jgi:PleD family two-component response regulator
MKQLSDQQNSMIADLQTQVGLVRDEVAELNAARADVSEPRQERSDDWGTVEPLEPHSAVPNSVLWADDYPENNALIVEQLQRNGVRVDLATSTRDGLAMLDRRRYGAVLSDMGRTEDGVNVRDAGASGITASPMVISAQLRDLGLL